MDMVRLAFIGCGGNARGHMNRLKQVQGAKIVSVCDLNEGALAEASTLTGGKPYTNYHDMLEREKLDAVYISIPVFAHGQVELDVLEHGLPFFVEKPVARDLETAARIARVVEETGTLACVGYQLRYLAHAREVKRWLGERSVSFVEGHYWCGTGYKAGNGWQGSYEKSGGQLVEQVTHTLDLARYFVGDMREVFCYQARCVLEVGDCNDVHAMAVSFDNGAVGNFSSVWHGEPSDWSEANILHMYAGKTRLRFSTIEAKAMPEDESFNAELPPGQNIDQIFVSAVRNNDKSAILSPYGDAVKSLAVSLAANESAKTGKPVVVRDLLKEVGFA